MTVPEKALYTIKEACEVLALSKSSVQRLINEGQLTRVYPRPRASRITRESLEAHLAKSSDRAAIRAAATTGQQAQAQARAVVEQEQKQKRRGGLLARWGLGG